jgi:hypothetical protein
MLKRFLQAFLLSGAVFSFAHIKPFPHGHVGFLHPEDLVVLGAVVVLAVGGLLVYRLAKRTA